MVVALDPLLVILSGLSAVTLILIVEYSLKIRKGEREYLRARTVVEDIVVSFNRELKRENGKLDTLAYRVETASSKTDGATRKGVELDGMFRALEGKIAAESDEANNLSQRVADLERKSEELAAAQQSTAAKLVTIEQQATELKAIPEANLESVIPLKRDKALAQLTNTEVAVLELLVSEGPKTAPEIKERVKLSREHTARLMKKLYEEGYLERITSKIPFKYTVKKEMESLLKKSQAT
jgi:predicted transcriptional regulator